MEQSLAIFSSAYLPPVPYIQLMLKHNDILLEKHETYPKQTYRNRCVIYSANGPLALTIPVVKPNGNRTKIADVQIDNSVKWNLEHWRAIESAYRNSAYFEFISDYLAPFYLKKWNFLWDFNREMLNTIFNILDIDKSIKETNSYVKDYSQFGSDFRYCIDPKVKDDKCFSNIKTTPYFQVFGINKPFEPNLSILDLICNCGMDSKKILKE
jgi:hypothetical protein